MQTFVCLNIQNTSEYLFSNNWSQIKFFAILRKDPYKAKLKVKQYGRQLGGPMITAHCPQPYFYNNPYIDEKGKIGPTYLRPKEKTKPFRFPGYIVPTGPAKWVIIFNLHHHFLVTCLLARRNACWLLRPISFTTKR